MKQLQATMQQILFKTAADDLSTVELTFGTKKMFTIKSVISGILVYNDQFPDAGVYELDIDGIPPKNEDNIIEHIKSFIVWIGGKCDIESKFKFIMHDIDKIIFIKFIDKYINIDDDSIMKVVHEQLYEIAQTIVPYIKDTTTQDMANVIMHYGGTDKFIDKYSYKDDMMTNAVNNVFSRLHLDEIFLAKTFVSSTGSMELNADRIIFRATPNSVRNSGDPKMYIVYNAIKKRAEAEGMLYPLNLDKQSFPEVHYYTEKYHMIFVDYITSLFT